MRHIPLLRIGGPLLVLVVFVALWYLYVWTSGIPSMVLPTPLEIVNALIEGFRTGVFFPHIIYTAKEVFAGFLIGSLLGIILGAPIALSPTIEMMFYPYLLALQTMPKIALAPLIMIWLGIGIESKILVTSIIALFPVMVNVITGLRTVDPVRISLIRSLNGNAWAEFRYIRLPNAAPFIFAGLKTAIVLSLLGAITAEFVGAEAGLGYLMNQMMFRLDTAGVFAVFLILAAIGITLFLAAEWLQNRIVFWDRPSQLSI